MKNKLTMPLTAIAYIVAFIGIQILMQSVALVVEMIINHDTNIRLDSLGLLISTGSFSLVTIALFAWLKWTPMKKTFIESRPWMTLFWCVVASLGAIIPSMFLQEMMPAWSDSIQRYIEEVEKSMLEIMNIKGGYAVICLLAPIAEEMVFRGAALRKLLEWQPERRWLMIFLSALLFALAHANPAQFIHPLLIGLLLGWMYERTGSIIPGVIYHWANNTAAYLLARIYQDPDITMTDIFGTQQHALLATLFSLLIFIPAVYQLNLWMKKR